MTFPSGARYDGQWRENEKHGEAVYTFPDGRRENQQWRMGEKI